MHDTAPSGENQWHGMTETGFDARADNWQAIGDIAQRMVMAWDKAEERDEATALVVHSTERQRALIFQAMWLHSTRAWRKWAMDWLRSDAAGLGKE
jgi:hypothetical protein